MRALVLALLLLLAAPAAADVGDPEHGPYYRVGPLGWEVYWNPTDVWESMTVLWATQYSGHTGVNFGVNDPANWYALEDVPGSSSLCDRTTPAVCFPNSDIDTWLDFYDNCKVIGNEQADFDGDGFGNPCDGDFDNSATVNVTDFNMFVICNNLAAANGGAVTGDAGGIDCHNVDMNTSGTINTTDFNLFIVQFNAGVPGP